MNWVKENIGKVISATALIFSVVGFLVGTYTQQQVLGEKISNLEKEIQDLKDGVIYDIRQWINKAR